MSAVCSLTGHLFDRSVQGHSRFYNTMSPESRATQNYSNDKWIKCQANSLALARLYEWLHSELLLCSSVIFTTLHSFKRRFAPEQNHIVATARCGGSTPSHLLSHWVPLFSGTINEARRLSSVPPTHCLSRKILFQVRHKHTSVTKKMGLFCCHLSAPLQFPLESLSLFFQDSLLFHHRVV